jgi:hypothetical protein
MLFAMFLLVLIVVYGGGLYGGVVIVNGYWNGLVVMG